MRKIITYLQLSIVCIFPFSNTLFQILFFKSKIENNIIKANNEIKLFPVCNWDQPAAQSLPALTNFFYKFQIPNSKRVRSTYNYLVLIAIGMGLVLWCLRYLIHYYFCHGMVRTMAPGKTPGGKIIIISSF